MTGAKKIRSANPKPDHSNPAAKRSGKVNERGNVGRDNNIRSGSSRGGNQSKHAFALVQESLCRNDEGFPRIENLLN